MILRRHPPDCPDLPAVLALIRDSFAPLNARIDPPSSADRLTLATLSAQAAAGEVLSLGTPPVACMILSHDGTELTVGKLAIAQDLRRQGLARRMLNLAEERARHIGLDTLHLQCRVELAENHALFRSCGFREVARTTHPGFSRPTSITFRKPL